MICPLKLGWELDVAQTITAIGNYGNIRFSKARG
jgi:hypothetical protein